MMAKMMRNYCDMVIRNYLCAPMSVYFNAYRDNAYNRGGEEILKVGKLLSIIDRDHDVFDDDVDNNSDGQDNKEPQRKEGTVYPMYPMEIIFGVENDQNN